MKNLIPGDITIILTTTAKHRLLPTILSRVQLIHFPQLSKEQRIQTLLKEGLTQEQAAVLSQLTSDTNQAIELSENETLTSLIDAMWKWYTHLSKKDEQAFIYVHTDIMPLVKGKFRISLGLGSVFSLYLQDILNSQISKDYHVGYLKHKKQFILKPSV